MSETRDKGSFSGFLGIDISKGTFDGCCIDREGKVLFHVSLPMNRAGFEKLITQVCAISLPQGSILIGMESTACYHVSLFSFLMALGYSVSVINPLLISNFVKLQLRKTKTDKKDAAVIARYLSAHGACLPQTMADSHVADLRALSRQRESLLHQMTALKCDIKRVLSITFPELERTMGIFTRTTLRLLGRFPSARALAQANREELAPLLHHASRGRSTPVSVDTLLKLARSSVGTANPSREMILRQKASILVHLEEHLREMTNTLIELCQSALEQDVEILTSIRGIGDKTAATFLIEMGGEIQKFDTHNKLIAMAGLDPSVYQSGQYDGHSRITKRGNRHLRRVIWLMTIRVIQFNDLFKSYYRKRIEDGLPFKKAVLATAHKLIRIIFVLLTRRTMFCHQVTS
jgi:transposase